jgi:hypothetical protein
VIGGPIDGEKAPGQRLSPTTHRFDGETKIIPLRIPGSPAPEKKALQAPAPDPPKYSGPSPYVLCRAGAGG